MRTHWIMGTLVAAALAVWAAPARADVPDAAAPNDPLAARAGGGTIVGYDGRPELGGPSGPLERVSTDRPMDNGTGSGTTWVSHAANPWAGPPLHQRPVKDEATASRVR